MRAQNSQISQLSNFSLLEVIKFFTDNSQINAPEKFQK